MAEYSTYIDPAQLYTAQSDRGLVAVTPALEDMSVAVDLEVECPRRNNKAITDNGKFILQFYTTEKVDGQSTVSFLGGSQFTDAKTSTKLRYLTNNGIEYVYGDEKNDEMFGIKSIFIDYSTFFVPNITIEFADVRGASLFSIEEAAHQGQGSSIGNENGSTDVVRSFFECFFRFPYPTFRLKVKGIYGKPVSYELMCLKCTSDFDSSTGNYNVTANMVGYAYSLLNDITLNALIAAPNEKHDTGSWGADYWNATFEGRPLPYGHGNFKKFSDILVNITLAQNEIEHVRTEIDEDRSKVSQLMETLAMMQTHLRKIKGYLQSFFETRNWQVNPYIDKDESVTFFGADVAMGVDDGSPTLKALETYINENRVLANYDNADFRSAGDEIKQLRAIVQEYQTLVASNGDGTALPEDIVAQLTTPTKYITYTGKLTHNITDGKYHTTKSVFEKLQSCGIISNGTEGQYVFDVSQISDDVVDNSNQDIPLVLASAATQANTSTYQLPGAVQMGGWHFSGGTDYYIYVIDTTEAYNTIGDIYAHYTDYQRDTTRAHERLANLYETKLGFKPSIGNIAAIICAHIETFLHCIKACEDSIYSDEIWTKRVMSLLNNMTDIANASKHLPPFPMVTENKDGRLVRSWPGSLPENSRAYMPEINLINGLLNGISELSDAFSNAQDQLITEIEQEENPTLFSNDVDIPCPIFPSDFICTIDDRSSDTVLSPFGKAPHSYTPQTDANEAINGFKCRYLSYMDIGVSKKDLGMIDGINYAYFYGDEIGKIAGDSFFDKLQDAEPSYTIASGGVTERKAIPFMNYDLDESWKKKAYDKKYAISTYYPTYYIRNKDDKKDITTSDVEFNEHTDKKPLLKAYNYNEFKTMLSGKLGAMHPDARDVLSRSHILYNNSINGYEAYTKGIVDVNKGVFHHIYDEQCFYGQNPAGRSGDLLYHQRFARFVNVGDVTYIPFYDYGLSGAELYNIDTKTGTVSDTAVQGYYENSALPFDEASIEKMSIMFFETTFSKPSYYKLTSIHDKAVRFLNSISIGRVNGYMGQNKVEENNRILQDNSKKGSCYIQNMAAFLLQGAYIAKGKDDNGIAKAKAKSQKKKYLLEKYLEWLDMPEVGFKSIMSRYELKDETGNAYTENQAKALFLYIKNAPNKEKDRLVNVESVAKDRPKVIVDSDKNTEVVVTLSNTLFGVGDKTYTSFAEFCGSGGLHGGREDCVIFYNNPNPVHQKISKFLLSPVIVFDTYGGDYNYDDIDKKPNKTYLENIKSGYEKAFNLLRDTQNQLDREAASEQVSMDINRNIFANDDVHVGLYTYIKTLYDRWLCGNTGRDGGGSLMSYEKLYGYDNFYTKHFKFIDTYYNKVGDLLVVNIGHIMEQIEYSLSNDTMSLLEFITGICTKNNVQFLCVQNFSDFGSTDAKHNPIVDAFKAIPYSQAGMDTLTTIPDFVFLYANQPSQNLDISGDGDYEYSDDSFDVSDDAIMSNLCIPNRRECKIPAFAVNYGSMYQHFFKDIHVGMDSSMATEQSIKATFLIANANANTDTNEIVSPIGQDLYSIYSVNSYKCELTMLGSAWIQPLMYFQLNNIPMYHGSYQIKKVTHQITPGNMTTHIIGVRQAKIGNRFITDYFMDATNMTGMAGSLDYSAKSSVANYNNDCGYEYCNVNTNTNEDDSLNHSVVIDVLKAHKVPSGTTNDDTMSMYDAILSGVINTAKDNNCHNNETAVKLIASVVYCRIKSNDLEIGGIDKLFASNEPINWKRNKINDTTYKNQVKWVKEIFTSSPLSLKGKEYDSDYSS